jgi:hypothetical protein
MGGGQLVKRLKVVQEAKEESWSSWAKEVYPSLLKQKKWCKYRRIVRVLDIVLWKY